MKETLKITDLIISSSSAIMEFARKVIPQFMFIQILNLPYLGLKERSSSFILGHDELIKDQ